MSNRHVRHFIRLYSALFKDALSYDPTLRLDFDRDLSRLKSSSSHMGDRVFLEHLPELGKVLDLALSQERLPITHLPLGGCYSGGHIPRLFRGIWLRIFEHDGVLKQDVDPFFVFFLRTLLRCGKKYEMECPPSALYKATEDFYVTDVSLPHPSLDWDTVDHDGFDSSCLSLSERSGDETDQLDLFGSANSDDTHLLDTVQRVADHISLTLGLLSTEAVRHGPGAVADPVRGVQKFAFPRWNPRLEAAFPYLGTAVPLSYDSDWDEYEIPSVLLAVPKTITGPRLIAKEPVDNVFAQFSLMGALYDRVDRCWISRSINYRDQQPSRDGALLGSLTSDFSTIDLKSASDRVSLWLVERIFRKNQDLLWKMRSCRTGLIDLTIDKKLDTLYRMKKFTTQGSALTFPIQSLVFLAICIAAGCISEGLEPNGRNIEKLAKGTRIFGDDIIVPKDWFDITVSLLSKLHLRVNANKTHSSGFFRESCGMDAYKGVDVTPPYVSRFGDAASPTAVTSVTECSNNFFTKGLWHAAKMIESTLPKKFRDNIPVRKTVDGGLCFISFSGDISTTRKRWNDDYQREEELRVVLKTRQKRLKAEDSLLLRAFLALRDQKPIVPSFEGIDDWYPISRWEVHPVERMDWVPTT